MCNLINYSVVIVRMHESLSKWMSTTTFKWWWYLHDLIKLILHCTYFLRQYRTLYLNNNSPQSRSRQMIAKLHRKKSKFSRLTHLKELKSSFNRFFCGFFPLLLYSHSAVHRWFKTHGRSTCFSASLDEYLLKPWTSHQRKMIWENQNQPCSRFFIGLMMHVLAIKKNQSVDNQSFEGIRYRLCIIVMWF